MPDSAVPAIHNENKPKDSSYTGYLVTILLFLFLQTGAAFFWAGGVSRSQENSNAEMKELKDTVNTLRNQFQVLSMQVSEMQGKQDAKNTKDDIYGVKRRK